MDEILIEEKRYISSKRAAKVTGYAKDYIGQLCREGRVPARLVGRNWYVLETAIHDHRFGSLAIEPVRDAEALESSPESVSPRYEAFSADELPQITHSQRDGSEPASAGDEQGDASQNLQDSWKEWFERIADTAASAIPDVISSGKPTEEEKEERDEVVADEKDENEVRIPIRAIHHQRYQAPPEELLPRRHRAEERPAGDVVWEPSVTKKRRIGRSAMTAIHIVGVPFAVLSVIFAVIGSGYFDTYIIASYSQASALTGISVYNK